LVANKQGYCLEHPTVTNYSKIQGEHSSKQGTSKKKSSKQGFAKGDCP
jgi:hypothetical protein